MLARGIDNGPRLNSFVEAYLLSALSFRVYFMSPFLISVVDYGSRREGIESCHKALNKPDPLLRPLFLKKLMKELRRANLTTGVDSELSALKWLRLESENSVDDLPLGDASAIDQRFLNVPELPIKAQRPWASIFLALSLLVSCAGYYLWERTHRPFNPRELPGGELFASRLPETAKEICFHPKAEEPPLSWKLSVNEATQLDPQSGQLVEELLQSTRELIQGELDDTYIHRYVSLNEQLQKINAPFYLEANPGVERRGVYIGYSTWYTQLRRKLRLGRWEIPSQYLWQLGGVTIPQHLQGYARLDVPTANIFLDSIESLAVLIVLPAMHPGEPMHLADEELWFTGVEWALELGKKSGEWLRAYGQKAFPEDPEIKRLAELLARRRHLVQKWSKELSAQRLMLRIPRKLIAELEAMKELSLHVPRADLREWESIDEELRSDELQRAFARFRDNLAQDVERHEAQHRADFMYHDEGMPEELARLVRWKEGTAPLGAVELAPRSREELSALLASVADSALSPTLTLLLSCTAIVNKSSGDDPYWYASLAALYEMGRQLNFDARKITGRVVTPEEAATLLMHLLSYPEEEIRQAAHRAYEQLFLRKVEKLEVISEQRYPEWRYR